MADATGTVVSPVGGIISGAGSIFQLMGQMEMGRAARIRGEQAAAMAEFNAWEANRQAGIAVSISQRQAAEERRQANLVASRALAVAAASGAGVSDPTMVRIIANARGEGAVRAATSLYEGAAISRKLRTEAITGRITGYNEAARGAATQEGLALTSMGTLAKEGMSLYTKYGMNGPGGDAALIQDQVPGQYSTSNRQYGG